MAIAKVLGPWGVRGEIKVARHSPAAGPLQPETRLLAGDREVTVERCRPHGGNLVVKLREIDDRTAAEKLRGTQLEVPEADLPPAPEGSYYEFQLVGLSAVSAGGEEIGTVSEVLATGANDVYVIGLPDGGQLLVPAIRDVVLSVDLEAGIMVVDPPKAL